MARIKEIVSLDGKRGTRVVKARGKRASRPMTKKEIELKQRKTQAIIFAGLDGKTNTQKRTGSRGKRVYTGGGF